MYFKQKSNTMFRNYESFGYITDNRNFGYKQTNDNEDYVGDKILSESGAVFMSILDKKPQCIDDLARKINELYTDVDFETIRNDAKEFFNMLESDGFIVSGNTFEECYEKDSRFSYKKINSGLLSGKLIPATMQPEKATQEFFEEHFNGKPQLTNLHLEIISKCNERCIHCYIPHDSKVSQMDIEVFDSILKQCVDMRVLNLTLSGGEPMLHKEFSNFLRKCRENDFSVNVLTNLTLVNDEIIDEMKMNPLLSVQVSLYSMDPIIHDEITQVKGSFNKTINAILELIKNDIPLQISCPIMKQNKNSYTEVKKWAERQKIHVGDDYGIIAEYNHMTENLSCRLSINEIKELINYKIKNDSNYLEQIEMAAEKKENIVATDPVCTVCRSTICIDDKGNVYPCEGWQDYVVGNVKEDSLNDIWDNSKKVQYLRSIQNQDFPKCVKCPDRKYCTMCMVRNANENAYGDPLVVNEFFCKVAKLNKQIVQEGKKRNIVS